MYITNMFFVKPLLCTYVGKQADPMQEYVKYIDTESALNFTEPKKKSLGRS